MRVIEIHGAIEQQLGNPAAASYGTHRWQQHVGEPLDAFRARAEAAAAALPAERFLLVALPA